MAQIRLVWIARIWDRQDLGPGGELNARALPTTWPHRTYEMQERGSVAHSATSANGSQAAGALPLANQNRLTPLIRSRGERHPVVSLPRGRANRPQFAPLSARGWARIRSSRYEVLRSKWRPRRNGGVSTWPPTSLSHDVRGPPRALTSALRGVSSSVGRAARLWQQGPHGLRVCFCPDQENTARFAFDQRGPRRQEARPGRCARQPFLRCEQQGRLGAGGPGAASILSGDPVGRGQRRSHEITNRRRRDHRGSSQHTTSPQTG
jgi:hypothetical protein